MLKKRLILITLIISTFSLTLAYPLPSLAQDPVQKKQEIESLKKQISSVDEQIRALEEEMISLNGRIAGLKQQIRKEQQNLKQVQYEIKQRERLLKERIKQLYIQDRDYGIAVILNSDGFWDLVRRVRVLNFITRAEAENIEELKKARVKEKELIYILEQDKAKAETYMQVFEQKKATLMQLKEELNRALKRANLEYQMMLAPSGIRKYASRGYITRGGGYLRGQIVPKKFVRVLPYGEVFLTSQRMPDAYEASGKKWTCYASWYGNEFHGRRTASGEIFNQWDYTVAHRTLPFGTFVLIRRGDRAVVAKVTDRGPFIPGREFDLSRACAEALGFSGVAKIEVEIIFPK